MLVFAAFMMIIAPTAVASDNKTFMQPDMKPITLTITPAATGQQLIRVALPIPKGLLSTRQTFIASSNQYDVATAVRVLTWYPGEAAGGRWARRALVTFPYKFLSNQPVLFTLRPISALSIAPGLPVDIRLDDETITLRYSQGPVLTAR